MILLKLPCICSDAHPTGCHDGCVLSQILDKIRAIPDGAKVYAYFVRRHDAALPQELALEERRARGGCQFGLTAEESEKLLKMKRDRRTREVAAHMTGQASAVAGTEKIEAKTEGVGH